MARLLVEVPDDVDGGGARCTNEPPVDGGSGSHVRLRSGRLGERPPPATRRRGTEHEAHAAQVRRGGQAVARAARGARHSSMISTPATSATSATLKIGQACPNAV